ncbi:MAG: F0F1 ATP synthase subunit delta [Pseudomonadota bacterium]
MSELITAARPYARAVFELAREQNRYADWSEMLKFMAAVAQDPSMRAALESPVLASAQSAELFISVCTDNIDESGRNFIKLLAENRRLVLLPDIAAQYEQYRADAEGKIEAEVVSARKITQQQSNNIATALKARLGREVTITTRTDSTLLGGAIIRAGDLVIDGSIRGKLNKLATAIGR